MSNWEFNIELNEVQNIEEPQIDSICAINSNLPNWLENGYLIASAPELLKACQSLINDFETDYMLDGKIVDNPSNLLIVNYQIAKEAVSSVLGS